IACAAYAERSCAHDAAPRRTRWLNASRGLAAAVVAVAARAAEEATVALASVTARTAVRTVGAVGGAGVYTLPAAALVADLAPPAAASAIGLVGGGVDARRLIPDGADLDRVCSRAIASAVSARHAVGADVAACTAVLFVGPQIDAARSGAVRLTGVAIDA